jgi:hypothetical protein
MYLGKVSREIFPLTNAITEPIAGSVMYVIGFFIALIMWGFGLVWFCLAAASIYQSRPFPFNMGWWGFTFPLGVFSLSTLQLGEELSSQFFKVLGTVRIATKPPQMHINQKLTFLDIRLFRHFPVDVCSRQNRQWCVDG